MNHRLLLFDIDGTLLLSAGAGRQAMNRAFQHVYGIQNGFETIPMMGRTDEGLLRDVLKAHDLPEDPEKAALFRTAYFELLDEELDIPRSDKSLCPGIMELLAALDSEKQLILGLLTGNWKQSAYKKLNHFGIGRFFRFGAFGGEAPNRLGLVPVALRKYRTAFGRAIAPQQIYVIGDTPRDIIAAKPHGVRTVGVATGFSTGDEIAEERPDIVFENFTDTQNVARYFLNDNAELSPKSDAQTNQA